MRTNTEYMTHHSPWTWTNQLLPCTKDSSIRFF